MLRYKLKSQEKRCLQRKALRRIVYTVPSKSRIRKYNNAAVTPQPRATLNHVFTQHTALTRNLITPPHVH